MQHPFGKYCAQLKSQKAGVSLDAISTNLDLPELKEEDFGENTRRSGVLGSVIYDGRRLNKIGFTFSEEKNQTEVIRVCEARVGPSVMNKSIERLLLRNGHKIMIL